MTKLLKTLALCLVAVAFAAPPASAEVGPQCNTLQQMTQIVNSVVGSNPVTSTGHPLFHAAVAALNEAGCKDAFCAAHAILIGGDCAPPVPPFPHHLVGAFEVDARSGTGCGGGVTPDAQPAFVTFGGTQTPVGTFAVALKGSCDAGAEDGRTDTQLASNVFVDGVAAASVGWYEHGTRAALACGGEAALWTSLTGILAALAPCAAGGADTLLP